MTMQQFNALKVELTSKGDMKLSTGTNQNFTMQLVQSQFDDNFEKLSFWEETLFYNKVLDYYFNIVLDFLNSNRNIQ